MQTDELIQVLERDAVSIFSLSSLHEALSSGKRLRVKLGADPNRPDLHLGHSVVLRKLRLFQEAGHEVVFVIGDFTAMIGDPSGKSKTRSPLTFEETRANSESYFRQVGKILDPEKTRITYNSEWLLRMNFSDILSLAGKYTLARILERDDFANRFTEKQPIGLHEIFYPLIQGYDSVALSADIEVGGTDQTFNLLVGRELQRDYGQMPQTVLTFPLLPGLDGVEKMSKSLNNYIGIDEDPETMFAKAMRVPDSVLPTYFRLTTDLSEESWMPILRESSYDAHFCYANEIVTLYHGANAAVQAENRYRAVSSGNIPERIPEYSLPVGSIDLPEILVRTGLAVSKSEARRLITGGGIRVDETVVTNLAHTIDSKKTPLIRRGKNRFVRIIPE